MDINLQKAREAGYSDEDIIKRISAKYPGATKAYESGHSVDDIVAKIGQRETGGSTSSKVGVEPEEKTGYMQNLGKYWTEDLPKVAKGVWDRTGDRADRIWEPTVGEEYAGKVTGGLPKPVQKFAGDVAGTLERVARFGVGIAETASDVLFGIPIDALMKSTNRLTKGKAGDVAESIARVAVESKPGQKTVEVVDKIDKKLSPATKANLSTIVGAGDIGMFRAAPKVAGKKTVNIGGETIPLPKGGKLTQSLGSVPGGRAAKDKYSKQVRDAVMGEVDKLRGTTSTFEDVADAAANAAGTKMKELDDAFNKAFGKIREAGKAGVKSTQAGPSGKVGLDADYWAESLRKSVNQGSKVFDGVKRGAKAVPDDIPGTTAGVRKEIKRFVDRINNLDQVSEAKRYDTFRQEKTNLGNLAFGADSYKLSKNDKTAVRNLYKKAVDLEREFIANQSAFWGADRKEVLDLFDKTNAFYAQTKPIGDFTKKVIGYSAEAGEKGHVTAQQALKSLLQPSKHDELVKMMGLLDNDAKQHLQNGLMVKLLDGALVEEKQFLSVTKLEKAMDTYGRKSLGRVLGADKVKRLEDLVDGMKKTGAMELKFADPSNKSGTASALLQKLVTGPTAVAAAVLSPKFAAATGGAMYANRLASHIIYNQPLSAVEQGIGALAGAGPKGLTSMMKRAPVGTSRAITRIVNPEEEEYEPPVLPIRTGVR